MIKPRQCHRKHYMKEITVGHASHASDERCKCSNDGNEARQENCLAAMFFKEGVCAVEIFPLNPFDIVGAVTQIMTDPIVDGVTCNCGNDQQQHQ